MIEDTDIAILADLDRLVSRYGAEAMTRVAELLRDPNRTEELSTAIDASVSHSSRRSGSSRVPRATDRVGISVLNELRIAHPEKHSVVAEIRRHLLSGQILRTMAEVRTFTWQHDLNIGKASSRNAAIPPFLRSISQLSVREIESLRDALIQDHGTKGDLERLSDVIVGPLD